MTDAAAALLAANRRRRSIRRWIAIGTLPLTLAAVLLTGKMLSMYAFAHQAISSYVIGDYAGSETAARGQEPFNWFQPFLAPYDVGTALAGADELDAARAKLTEALPLAHGLEVCAVRVNLALVIERMGDAAAADGDGSRAVQLYGEALQVTAETPEECAGPEADAQSPDPDRSLGDALDGLQDRLQEKGRQTPQPPPSEGDDREPQPRQRPDEDQLDDLEDRLNQGSAERDERDRGEDGGSGGTDRPW